MNPPDVLALIYNYRQRPLGIRDYDAILRCLMREIERERCNDVDFLILCGPGFLHEKVKTLAKAPHANGFPVRPAFIIRLPKKDKRRDGIAGYVVTRIGLREETCVMAVTLNGKTELRPTSSMRLLEELQARGMTPQEVIKAVGNTIFICAKEDLLQLAATAKRVRSIMAQSRTVFRAQRAYHSR